MTVKFNDNEYEENDGIIFVPDAQSGNYDLKVQGVDQGKYEVVVGQISENNDLWVKIEGEIVQSPADTQTDDYTINYDNQNALSVFPTPTIINKVPTGTWPSPTSAAVVSTEAAPTSTPLPTASTNPNPTTMSSSTTQLFSDVLGTSTTKPETENQKSKKSSIWDYIFPPLITAGLGVAAWIFRKKIFKKFNSIF